MLKKLLERFFSTSVFIFLINRKGTSCETIFQVYYLFLYFQRKRKTNATHFFFSHGDFEIYTDGIKN